MAASSVTKMFAGRFASFVPSMARSYRQSHKSIHQAHQHPSWHKKGAAVSSKLNNGGRAFSSSGAVDTGMEMEVILEPLDAPNEGVFQITLNRPQARNAIGRRFLQELREALQNAAGERTTRCLVVRSSVPGVFCAGADLKERSVMTRRETEQFVSLLRSTFCELERLPMPTIAAIDGYALGGGLELALACDLRVASAGSTFALPETRLGIIPGAGGTQRLPRIIGTTQAKELVFTGRRIQTSEAVKRGLVDHQTEEGQAVDRALELAREIAQGAPLALRMAKHAIDVGSHLDASSGQLFEAACYAQVIPTEDRLEGLRAFAEKRPPRFTGE